MSSTSNRSATEVDKIIGKNIRFRRLSKGVTQEALAKRLGVTFRQIQKYETGDHRVGTRRLYQIAELLEVPVTSFFEEEQEPKTIAEPSLFDLLKDPLSLKMAEEFSKIGDKKIRRALLVFIETLVSSIR